MPMFDEYGDGLKSYTADIKQEGDPPAGAIIAVVFLRLFVGYPWHHLDIAGLVSIENERRCT